MDGKSFCGEISRPHSEYRRIWQKMAIEMRSIIFDLFMIPDWGFCGITKRPRWHRLAANQGKAEAQHNL